MANREIDPKSMKVIVTDIDGEISCSVEETNRIRSLLGLKPLKLDKPTNETDAMDNYNNVKR